MTISAFTWTDRARPIVEIGVGDSRTAVGQVWDTARWDTDAVWSGLDPEWLDVSCDTRSASCTYGRQAVTDRFIVGTATVIVDNTSGWADPNTVDAAAELTMRPGRQIRISINHQVHGKRVLFRGYIDAITPTYDPVESDTVTLDCIDALGEVNRAKLLPLPEPVGDGEVAHTRMYRILNSVDWLPSDIGLSYEQVTATTLGGQVADLLGVTAESVGGVVFGDHQGRVAFRGMNWLVHQPGSPVDGTIGNVGDGSPNRVTFDPYNYLEDGDQVVWGATVPADVCPVQWERPFNRADIATRVIIKRPEPPLEFQFGDTEGIRKYGIEPFERSDLIAYSQSTLYVIATRLLVTRGEQTAPRVRSVTLDARTADNALDLMSTVDVYKPSRYRCRLKLDRGLVFDAEYFATGVTHEITPNSWTLALNLDVAAPFAIGGGRWDGDHWDTGHWTALAELRNDMRELIGELTS